MSFTRRQIIEAGAATGALGLMASSPLLAAAIDAPDVRRRPDMAPAQPVARPRVMVDPNTRKLTGVDLIPLREQRCVP